MTEQKEFLFYETANSPLWVLGWFGSAGTTISAYLIAMKVKRKYKKYLLFKKREAEFMKPFQQ